MPLHEDGEVIDLRVNKDVPGTQVKCPVCVQCQHWSYVGLDDSAYRELLSGKLIQEALPHLSPSHREMLITGTHGDCWDELWADDDDAEDFPGGQE